MAATEVTQAQYERVMGYNPTEGLRGPQVAVNKVSWRRAVEFCRRLTELERLDAHGLRYRLPTEAEWEYACRAGTQTRFWFGDALECSDFGGDNCGIFERHMWYGSSHDLPLPAPVGVKPANPWGLHDIHGNMAEWCQDWYGPYPLGEVTDPSGPREGARKVLRGNALLAPLWGRSAARSRAGPNDAEGPGTGGINFGFRVVLGGCPAPPYSREP
jgi:sulfatase modifying factor 1